MVMLKVYSARKSRYEYSNCPQLTSDGADHVTGV